ncbi:MAG: hypothetical protein EOS78_30655 [Mesorhizobium sp.]|nr:MAG: hypothetical protein EOS78_30655 [Mesorhizobium sp.]
MQKDYEAALGAFLVIFNRIENTVSDIVVLALKKAEREDILRSLSGDLFARKLTTLELLSVAYPQAAPRELVEELRRLGAERNNLAHGHFDQNPFDGSYRVVTDRNTLSISVAQIGKLTARADKAWDELRSSQAFFWFDDLGSGGD